MTDFANLVLAIDSRQVKDGTAALDGLTAAGGRAQAAASGLGGGIKGAAAEATAMATAAQATARAAVGQAAAFGVASNAVHGNTIAMRESLVVTRELMRGNLTRLPGSLSILATQFSASGKSAAGFASQILQAFGIIKTVQNTELAGEAAAAAAASASVRAAAERAAGAVMAADTEVALAQAAIRTAETTEAEAAAQQRLAAAHVEVAAAAGEATIAEVALADAEATAREAAAAAAATTTTALGTIGALLVGVGIPVGLLAAAFLGVKDAAEQADPSAKNFIATLGLTRKEVEKLKDETVTWGDVAHGTFNAVADAAGISASRFKSFWHEAFLETAQVGVSAAQVIAAAFAATASISKNTVGLSLAITNPALAGLFGNALPDPKKVGQDALSAFEKQFAATGKFFHSTLPASVNASRDSRLQDEANKIIGDRSPGRKRHPRQPADHSVQDQKAYDDQVAKLNEQILTAKQALGGGIQDEAKFQLEAVETEKNKTILDAQALLKEHKINAAQESYIETKAEDLAVVKAMKIERDAELASMKAAQALSDQQYQFQVDDLKYANDMATNQADRRAIQLEMLDIETKRKDAALKALMLQEAANNDWANYAVNAAALYHSPTEKAQAQGRIMQGTRGPLQQWEDSIQKSAPDINEALQSIETKGFDGLSSAIAGVVTGTESLKSAFKNLAQSIITDIIEMTVKMLIFKALTAAFGGGSSSIPTINVPAFGSANGNIFSGGSIIPFANGGIFSSPTLFPMAGGRTGLMGEAGPEAVMPLTRDSSGKLGVKAANSNTSQQIEIVVSFGDAPDFAPYVQEVSSAHAAQAIKISVDHTNQTIRSLARPKLMGS